MATFTKRGPHQYQATIRRVGFPTQARTFETMRDARDWAATVESEMRRGLFADRSEVERTTLGQLLERYGKEVTPTKRGQGPERSRLKRLMTHPIALQRLAALQSADFSDYREERLSEEVSGKTVREELILLSAVLTTAREEWSIPVENWAMRVRKPSPGKHRERRLVSDEEAKLMAACRKSKNVGLACAVVLAIETGMRRGEIAQLSWEDVDFHTHIITLELTKNGDKRIVPLSERAELALRQLPRNFDGRVFTFHDSNGLGASFACACERAGIKNLRFHDLRHEAASRYAPRMPATALAKLMGWRSLQMTLRYYNPHPHELVALVRSA